jgi:hypothetical protein
LIDLECGWNAGVARALLVRTGYGAQLEAGASEDLGKAVVINDLPQAAEWILANARTNPPLDSYAKVT